MILVSVLIPFLGTILGSLGVFFIRHEMSVNKRNILTGFAAGVMVAASIWSLLIPALEQVNENVLPVLSGFSAGIVFLLVIDALVPHMHSVSNTEEGLSSNLSRTIKMLLAVTIHNIPEGIAVGVMLAGALQSSDIQMGSAFALSVGIALQNFPEGAIVSMPLATSGITKSKSFMYGVLSGVVEPIAAILTLFMAESAASLLPFLLSFASGAMFYVVVEEMIPEMAESGHSRSGVIAFAIGFQLMMVLDVLLG